MLFVLNSKGIYNLFPIYDLKKKKSFCWLFILNYITLRIYFLLFPVQGYFCDNNQLNFGGDF